MTSVAFNKMTSSPNLEKKKKKKKKNDFNTKSWAPKGSYRLEYVLKLEKVPAQPCSFFPRKRKIFTR